MAVRMFSICLKMQVGASHMKGRLFFVGLLYECGRILYLLEDLRKLLPVQIPQNANETETLMDLIDKSNSIFC